LRSELDAAVVLVAGLVIQRDVQGHSAASSERRGEVEYSESAPADGEQGSVTGEPELNCPAERDPSAI
jgi:hypothetical protein